MKKIMTLVIVSAVISTLAFSGCEKKSDAEKAFDGLKKDAQSLTK
jgi:outer membrane murein-binding lipoprotein Lpp